MTDELKPEDRAARGAVVWHCSEEEGGPDVGMSLGLGDGRALYMGELADETIEACGIDPGHDGTGWWLALDTASEMVVFGAVVDQDNARAAFDVLEHAINRSAAALEEADAKYRRYVEDFEARQEARTSPPPTVSGELPEGCSTFDDLIGIARCITANVEEIPTWGDNGQLVTIHAHAAVLTQDLPHFAHPPGLPEGVREALNRAVEENTTAGAEWMTIRTTHLLALLSSHPAEPAQAGEVEQACHPLDMKLEAECRNMRGDAAATYSAAISLKRIADTIDGTAAGLCVTETLLGGRAER